MIDLRDKTSIKPDHLHLHRRLPAVSEKPALSPGGQKEKAGRHVAPADDVISGRTVIGQYQPMP
jgi:hypothetical protein